MRARLSLALVVACALAVPAAASAAGTTTVSFTSVQAKPVRTKTGFVTTGVDLKGRTRIGTDRLTCTYVSGTKASCRFRVALTGRGTIRGRLTLGSTTTQGSITVLGGSGAYQGAAGHGIFVNLNASGTRTAVTFHLT